MKIYLGGVIQASFQDNSSVNQDYRQVIEELLKSKFPGCEIYCPYKRGFIATTNDEIKSVFAEFLEYISKADLFIGYFPVASNGTAIELYHAWQHNVKSIVISPMKENWALRAFSEVIVIDIAEFEEYLSDFEIKR